MNESAMSAAEKKLARAQELIIKPIDLSEEERKRLEEVVNLMKESLDEMLKEVLTKPRDEAFTIVREYTIGLQTARSKIQDGVEDISEEAILPKEAIPVIHPELDDLFYGIPAGLTRRAREVLSCVKEHNKLMEEGEDGTLVLCPECTPKKMVECIQVEDPAIVDELDEELRKMGLLTVNNA